MCMIDVKQIYIFHFSEFKFKIQTRSSNGNSQASCGYRNLAGAQLRSITTNNSIFAFCKAIFGLFGLSKGMNMHDIQLLYQFFYLI